MASKPLEQSKQQSEAFIKAARELECDDSEERFGALVTKLAKAGPQHKPSKPKPKAR